MPACSSAPGKGLAEAGPAVLISYLAAGTLIILVMWALGEMAAANPNSGAFSVYAQKAMGPVAGSTVGWLWWLQLVVVIAAEALGAAALLVSVWPVIPVWALTLIFMVVFTAINLTTVKNYGEFEFWFALLKVGAIVLFLVFGAAASAGLAARGAVAGAGQPCQQRRLCPQRPVGNCHGALCGGLCLWRHGNRGRCRSRDRRPPAQRGHCRAHGGVAHPGVLHRLHLCHCRRAALELAGPQLPLRRPC